MKAAHESQDPGSRWDDIAAERSAVEGELRAVRRHIEAVPGGSVEARQLRREAGRLRDEHQRLTAEADRNGLSVATLPRAPTGIEHEMERRRIALQILAVVIPWRDALREMDSEECNLFRVRAHALLNYLDVAVMPHHPDLQDALAAARAELGSERPRAAS